MFTYPDGGLTRHTVGLVCALILLSGYFGFQVILNGWAQIEHQATYTVLGIIAFALWGYSEEAHERHDAQMKELEARVAVLESHKKEPEAEPYA